MSATTTLFPKAVIFDAYGTLFDVHSVVAAAEQMFPGHGDALSQLWRQKQIEYTQLRTLADPAGARYQPFWNITLDALRFSARKLGLTLNAAGEKRLMDEYACLSAFPDVLPALRQMRGMRTPGQSVPAGPAILSNGNPEMLEPMVKASGLADRFEAVISVDAARVFKVDPRTYQLVEKTTGVKPDKVCFLSSNCWDAHGAAHFGFKTLWVNRGGLPEDNLPGTVVAHVKDLSHLPSMIGVF